MRAVGSGGPVRAQKTLTAQRETVFKLNLTKLILYSNEPDRPVLVT